MNTTMTTTVKTPTNEAIDTAIRNAVKMIAEGYTVKQSKDVPTTWFCIKPGYNGRFFYMVNVERNVCNCPQFALEGVCKHQKFVDDEIRLREEEEAQEVAWEAFAEMESENFAEGGTWMMSV